MDSLDEEKQEVDTQNYPSGASNKVEAE